MRLSLLSVVGLGAVAIANNNDLRSPEVCRGHAPLVDLMLREDMLTVRPFCQQLCSSNGIFDPVTVTVVDVLKPSTVVTTVYHTQTRTVDSVTTALVTVVESSEVTVTDQFTSTGTVTVDVTTVATDVESATVTATETVTDTISATITNTATLTDVNTITSYTTSTITVTATSSIAPQKRDTKDIPEPFRPYAVENLRAACWCLPLPTTYKTVTPPRATETRTVVLPTTVVNTNVLTHTAYVTESATVDVTAAITQSSTVTVTTTTTVQTTVSVTVDQTVDTTVTQTATATVTGSDSVTTTEPVTVTATATPTATCGVNLLENSDFESLTLSPWDVTVDGAFTQEYNSDCGVSNFCLLFYGPGSGSFTLAQTIATVSGETYTVSFDYHTWAAPTSGTTLTCMVNNEAATSWPVSLSVSTASWATFSGTFVASNAATTFSCLGATSQALTLNFSVFDIQC